MHLTLSYLLSPTLPPQKEKKRNFLSWSFFSSFFWVSTVIKNIVFYCITNTENFKPVFKSVTNKFQIEKSQERKPREKNIRFLSLFTTIVASFMFEKQFLNVKRNRKRRKTFHSWRMKKKQWRIFEAKEGGKLRKNGKILEKIDCRRRREIGNDEMGVVRTELTTRFAFFFSRVVCPEKRQCFSGGVLLSIICLRLPIQIRTIQPRNLLLSLAPQLPTCNSFLSLFLA